VRNLITTLALVSFSAVGAAADPVTPLRTIDLNQPAVLDSLRHDNPLHYEKISKIVDGLVQQSDTAVPRWMQTNFDAHNVQYGPVLLTSYPPQKNLLFTLDNTRYKATVTLTKARAEIVPAK